MISDTASNDYFFPPGHTALAVYRAIQLAMLRTPVVTAFGIPTAILQMVLVIILRAHWMLDVVAGRFAAMMVGALSSPGQWRKPWPGLAGRGRPPASFGIDVGQDGEPGDEESAGGEHGHAMVAAGNPADGAVGQRAEN